MITQPLADYDRQWQIELRAEALFKADFPTGAFARRLPQFRSSGPDAIGDIYRRQAVRQLAHAIEEED